MIKPDSGSAVGLFRVPQFEFDRKNRSHTLGIIFHDAE